MYVRFEQPKDSAGNLLTTTLKGKGLLVARAAIGPFNPMLPNVEVTSFGIWKSADGRLSATIPSGMGSFPHLAGKLVTKKVDEDGVMSVETSPSIGGKQEIEKLLTAMITTFKANEVQAFAPAARFELPSLLPPDGVITPSAGGNASLNTAAAAAVAIKK